MNDVAKRSATELQPVSGEKLALKSAADTVQLLTFYLAEEMFSFRIEPIKEIIEYGKVTVVPMVPDFVRGVINVRGQVVPVIDLPVRFGWQSSLQTKRSCIVILEVEHEGDTLELGVVIDSVSEVLELPTGELGAAPSFGAKIRTDFIEAMARIGDDFVVVLDPARVLSVEELSSLQQVADHEAVEGA